jgi:alkanesulfonate monooxygenase SsuD/methylene tetrahydromethanopterin reductase-like flavin-dependent oxidoreductase (luciferase family)
MPAARLDVLREHIRVCRDLLAGKTTPYQEGERRRMIKFLNPKSGAIDIKKKIPIYMAASGAKSLELAGEIADGVIMFGAVAPSLIDFHMSHVRAGAERAGRDPKKIYMLGMTAFHLTKPGERLETPRVRRAVGPFVSSSSNLIAFASPNPEDLPADLRAELTAFRTAYREPDEPIETRHLKLYSDYLQGFKKEHEPLVTEKMIRATTLTGTREEVTESIHAMRKAGLNQVAVQAITDPRETIETFSRQIIKRMK